MALITFSNDKHQMDAQMIHNFIISSYWGEGRTMAQTKKSIEQSLNFGMFEDGIQIGYARVVSDYCMFAYLMDVFIVPEKQGRGYSKQLLHEVFNHPPLKDIVSWKLATNDAHELYKKFGFAPLVNPEIMMEKKRESN